MNRFSIKAHCLSPNSPIPSFLRIYVSSAIFAALSLNYLDLLFVPIFSIHENVYILHVLFYTVNLFPALFYHFFFVALTKSVAQDEQ